ncbi:pilus assembly protein [bacterium]|nr:pilus assembly protein [bacterium]
MRRFNDDEGAVTVEASLWIPFFVFLITMVADVSLVFYGQARAMEIAQDGNRAYSIGTLATQEEAKTYITERLATMSPNATAQVSINRGLITTVVNMPSGDLDAVGFFTSLASMNVQVVAQMVKEF